MDSKQSNMEAIFRQLSEQNQDVMILLAKSMAVAQAACMKEAGQKLNEREDKANVNWSSIAYPVGIGGYLRRRVCLSVP